MIKKSLNPGNYEKNISRILLLLRLTVGIFMLTHGSGKLLKLFGDAPIQFADPIGLGATTSLALTVFAEVLCSILLILGLATRLAAIPLLVTMLVAVFIIHAGDVFGNRELALLYAIIYFVFVITGAGNISVDNWLYRKVKPS